MAFAKEYADQGRYSRSELRERLADGRIAGMQIVLNDPSSLFMAEAYFNGEAAYIGYPKKSGSGIYMEAQRFYLNRCAGNKEGALDFLRYLLSGEGQQQYMTYSSISYDFMGYNSWTKLPVRRSVLLENLDRYQKNPPNGVHYDYDGTILYQDDKMSEEQVETFWRILDNAIPAVFRADDIWSMVDEELQPYFSDECSAEEAARKLHSRVQIYLDERK